MTENSASLLTKLAKARQQLKKIQAQIADLENQLGEYSPNAPPSLLSKDRYYEMLDHGLEGCQVIGFDWRYLYINDTAERHSQRKKAELLGYAMMERYPGIEQSELFAVLQRCMQERTVQRMGNKFVYPDNTVAWFDLNIEPVPEGIVIFSLDVTAHKQAEKTLNHYARRLEILHQIDLGIIEAQSVENLVELALTNLRELIPFDRARIAVFDEQQTEAVIFAVDDKLALPISGTHIPLPSGILDGFDGKTVRIINDLQLEHQNYPFYSPLLQEGLLSALQALLVGPAGVIGVLGMAMKTQGFFTAEHQEIAVEIANQFALALHQMRLSEALENHTKTVERTREFLQATLDSFPANTVVLDPDGTIVTVNLPWKQFAEANNANSQTHYMGENYLTVCDTAVGLSAEEAAIAATGIRAVIAGQQHNFYLEYPCHSSLEKRWFGLRVTPFDELTPRRVVLAHINITERKQAEDALQESYTTLGQRVGERTAELQSAKDRVEAILNNSLDSMLLLSFDLLIQQANPAFNRLFACKMDDYFERPVFDLVHPDEVDYVKATIQAGRKEQIGKNIEIHARRKDGTFFDAALSIGFIKNYDCVCTIRDISEQKSRERQLRYHASLQESVSDAVIVLDMAYNVQSWNKAAEDIYGWTAEEAVGQQSSKFLHYEASPEQFERDMRHLQEHGWLRGEIIQFHKDGHPVHIWSSITRFKDEHGNPFSLIVINHDITERKAQERQLRYYASIQESVSDAVITTDLEFRIQTWNTAAEQLYGWSAEEAFGKNALDVLPDQSRSDVERQATADEFLKNGKWVGEVTHPHKNGSAMHLLRTATLLKDDNEQSFGVVVVYHDITARKQTELAVAEERNLLRTLIDTIPDYIYIKDTQHRFILSNQAHNLARGKTTSADLIGKTDSDLFPADLAEQFFSEEETIFQTGQSLLDHEQVSKSYEGGFTWASSNKVPLRNLRGELIGLVGITRDITERKAQERLLRFYASLQQNISDAVISTDMQFRIQAWNKAAERIYGWSEDEVKDRSVGEVLQTQYATDQERQAAIQQLQQQGWWYGEARQRHKDGRDIYLLGSVTLIKDEHGVPIGVVSVNHDVTERKQAEEALQKSTAEIHDLYNNAPCGYHSVDKDGVIVQINDTELNWLGYTREEVINKLKIASVLTPESALKMSNSFPAFKERGWVTDLELDIVRKDGSIIHIILNGTAIYDEQGQYIKSRSILFDITELRRVQRAIVESESRYRLLAENITDVIIRITPDGTYLYVSPSAINVMGYEPEEMIGKSIYDFTHPDDVARLRKLRQESFALGVATPFTYQFLHRAGHIIWIEVVRQSIRSETTGEIVEYVSSARDITDRKQAEDALKRNERLLRLILDTLPVGVWMLDLKGNITLGNPAGQRLWAGVKYVGLEQYGEYKAWWVETGKLVEAQDWAATRAITKGEISINEELEIEAFDGTRKYILNSGLPIRDEQGNILGAITVNQDITERKQAEQAIRDSEEKFRQLLDAAPIATVITDQTGHIILVNIQAEAQFGYQRSEMIGQSVEILVPEAVRSQHTHNRRTYLESPQMREMGSGMELFARRKDGSYFPVEIQLSSIQTRDGIMVMSFIADITDRKRIAAELESQRIFLRQVIDVSPSMIFVKDYDGRFVLVNPMVTKIYNTPLENLIGKTDADFTATQTQIESFLEADRRVITSGEPLFIEESITDSVGEIRWLQTTKVPIISEDGNSKYVLGVSTDITERRRSEEALRQALEKEKELGELKSRFVSMASHEFRTPLATILAFVETLSAYRHRLSDDQIEQRLDKIKVQVDHLKNIMDDVLMLARMQARRVEFNPVKLDLDALCRSVLDEFQNRVDVKQPLNYTCDDSIREANMDRKLMRQIISNLVSNAIKYSPEDKAVTITLEYAESEIILKVGDEGIGIPEMDLVHLFEPFHRGSNVEAISGTGLGLVITKEAVELHGGTISVESQVNRGTTFTVRVPALGVTNHGENSDH